MKFTTCRNITSLEVSSAIEQLPLGFRDGDIGALEQAYRVLAAARAEIPTASRATAAMHLYNFGVDLKQTPRVDLAEAVLRLAADLGESVGSPHAASAQNHLGLLARDAGRVRDATRRFANAIKLREQAAPLLTDDAWVYLAGAHVNMANAACDDWCPDVALDCANTATTMLERARGAGSTAPALAPFLANALAAKARAHALVSLPRPQLQQATLCPPPSREGLLETFRAFIGNPRDALEAALSMDAQASKHLKALVLGDFLSADDEPLDWQWDRHDGCVESFDDAIEYAPDDLGLRVFKARALSRGALVGQAGVQVLHGGFSEAVFAQLSIAPKARAHVGAVRLKDALNEVARLGGQGALVEFDEVRSSLRE